MKDEYIYVHVHTKEDLVENVLVLYTEAAFEENKFTLVCLMFLLSVHYFIEEQIYDYEKSLLLKYRTFKD